jgi:hypothetical protein
MNTPASTGPEYPRRKRALTRALIIFLAWLSIVFIFYPGLFLDFSSRVPFGDHGDVRNILSIIQYSTHTSLTGLYHLPFLYPESYVTARTHPLFGISLFFKGFQALGFNLEQSTNLYIILALLIGAWGCYLLIREFVRDHTLALVFSALFIVYGKNTTYFHWLNFLSHFYFPFVFYFFIRYAKTRERKYIYLFSLFAFLQFLASVYYGVQLWVFVIPVMLGSALLLRMIKIRDLGKISLGLGAAFLLILIIFLPYSMITQPTIDKGLSPRVVNAEDLFTNNKLMGAVLQRPEPEGSQFFPGYAVLLCALYLFPSLWPGGKRKYMIFGILAAILFLMTYLTFTNLKLLDIVLFGFLCGLLVLIFRGWRTLSAGERLLLLVFGFYLALLLSLPRLPILGSLSLYSALNSLLPFSGLKAIARVLPLALPLLIVLAALGGQRMLDAMKNASKRKAAAFSGLVLLLMMAENFPLRHPALGTRIMQELPTREAAIYSLLPFQQDRVILEIPHYFRLQKNKNTLYTLNWIHHRNALINGKVSVDPESFTFDLRRLLGTFQKTFPDERMLRHLIQKYSVTHILVHWDLLWKYNKDPKARESMLSRFESLRKYTRVLHDDEHHTLFRLQEFFSQRRIVRTFSSYHLRNRVIDAVLEKPYSGQIRLLLNNRLVETRRLDKANSFLLDLRRNNLYSAGNRIEIVFNRPVRLKDIRLTRPSKDSAGAAD